MDLSNELTTIVTFATIAKVVLILAIGFAGGWTAKGFKDRK